MENLKVRVNSWNESKEVQELFIELGATCGVRQIKSKWVCLYNSQIAFYDLPPNVDLKYVTLQYLKHLVILKRNSIDDATHYYGVSKYYLTDNEFYQYSENKWVNIDEYVDGMTFKKIEKGYEVKMKEYLELQKDGSYDVVLAYRKEGNDWIEVPEGAEIFLLDESCGEDIFYFVKHDGDVFHEYYISGTDIQNNTWIKGTIKVLHEGMGEVLWERNHTETDTSTQEKLKFINKDVEVKKKEFLNPEQGYSLVKCCVGETPIPKSWIEVPEGAEEYRANYKFYKNNGELFYSSLLFEWAKSSMPEYKTLWKRNPELPNTLIQDKLKFIEKWLNGEKIQYILGIESEKTQWHNFTEGAMQYIKRSDIKFREAPKYVKINGIEFKSVEKLMKYVKNNFDLEDGEND